MKKVHPIQLVLGLVIVALIASGWPKADPSSFGRRTHTFHPKASVAERSVPEQPPPADDHDGVYPNLRGTPDADWTYHLDRVNRRLDRRKEAGR